MIGGRRTALSLTVYLVIAFGLSWLIALPLWLSGQGLQHPLFGAIAVGMMATPAIGALVAVFVVERGPNRAERLGLWPLRPAGRFWMYLGLGLVVPVALVVAALVIGALLGTYPADFARFSGYRSLLAATGAASLPIPIGLLVAAQYLNIVVGAALNLIPALGEELGWRGWLLPKLLPLGTVPALLISGAVWGLWHAPLILLGYNYPTASGWLGVLLMMGMCVVMGGIFGWLRIRSRSVWPAALAHGALNASVGLSAVYARAGESVDTVQATILGWSGWIAPAVVVIVLLIAGQFRWPTPAEQRRRRAF
ncbi:CAAX protease self-immunity [Paramicrobacterium humi]|uniref:CAAX protease self-immunity n=1 Tax=Paramicrobacterium humi TaxID=640635 RepID=A0A1H4J9E0_9MICO|nr:CPBP family intramembrane glutamic endopeptidase [Microbacterium humi]SEB42841.1 CAAX protease self-immunity [Microbacterium humi]